MSSEEAPPVPDYHPVVTSRGALPDDLALRVLAPFQPHLLPGARLERLGPKSLKIESRSGLSVHRAFFVSRFHKLTPRSFGVCVWEVASICTHGDDRQAFDWADHDDTRAVITVSFSTTRVQTHIEWPDGALDIDHIDVSSQMLTGRSGQLVGKPGARYLNG
jgi:hypothetical protein